MSDPPSRSLPEILTARYLMPPLAVAYAVAEVVVATWKHDLSGFSGRTSRRIAIFEQSPCPPQ
ncbi:hypothetical protein Dimus_017303 [Dionaea muscipula]